MAIPNELEGVVAADADILSGALRFKGTRVPVQALLDTLTCNRPIDYFLEGVPDVSEEQALAVIAWEQNQARLTFGLELVA